MNPNPVFWNRSRYAPGGSDALVAFEVCGDFPAQIETDFAVEGIEVRWEVNDFARFEAGVLEALRESDPAAAPSLEAAPRVVTIRGIVPDPADLHYLRDCLQLVAQLLDNGGVGVIEPQSLQLYSPAQWREKFWSGAFEPTFHAVILLSMEGEKVWLHTRGMRLFGRPDLSCHGVLPAEVELLRPVFNGLMRMQAAGALIPEGQMVQAVGIENRLICHHAGDLEKEFNNVHIELEWETPRATS